MKRFRLIKCLALALIGLILGWGVFHYWRKETSHDQEETLRQEIWIALDPQQRDGHQYQVLRPQQREFLQGWRLFGPPYVTPPLYEDRVISAPDRKVSRSYLNQTGTVSRVEEIILDEESLQGYVETARNALPTIQQ